MPDPAISYDEPSDTVYVAFAPGVSATGLELNENILLRVDAAGRRAIGITFFNYSVLAQQTELGPRSFPLSGLASLTPEMRELAVSLLHSAPLREYLATSSYTPAAGQTVPITMVQPEKITPHAA